MSLLGNEVSYRKVKLTTNEIYRFFVMTIIALSLTYYVEDLLTRSDKSSEKTKLLKRFPSIILNNQKCIFNFIGLILHPSPNLL